MTLFPILNIYLDNQPRIADYGPSWNVIEKGSTLTLRCRSVQTVIKWFKDGRQVFPVDDQRFDLNDFNDLVIINAQPGASNSEGKYTCTATNSVNTTSPGYNLEVIVQCRVLYHCHIFELHSSQRSSLILFS